MVAADITRLDSERMEALRAEERCADGEIQRQEALHVEESHALLLHTQRLC